MRMRVPVVMLSWSSKPAGTNIRIVEPCWNPPISSPLPKRASTGISFGPR